SYIYFFSIIAFFILLIACINFMNMATARYANRAKEVGIRKVVGSTRIQLIQQFFTESILISLLAIVFTVAIIELVLPYFNFLTSKELEIGYLSSWYILPSLVVFGLLVGILAGSYPAFYLSSFQPVRVLKGEVKAGGKSNRFRKILVVIQFTITISLITGTLLVSDQLEYWQSRDHGYEREGVLVLKRTHILGDRQKAFREELMKNEEIKNASFCSSLPGYDFGGTSFHRYGAPSEELVQTILIQTDEHYLETMNIELAEGRFFSQEYGTDEDAVVINETLVRVMGLQDPVNESIVFPHISIIAPVIGVIKDVNFESLHRNIRPMTIRKLVDPGWLMAIRIDNENIPDVISSIEQTWNDFTGEAPYIYSFLEDDLLELYSNEMRTGRIFTIFSVLAIIIACMGLLGMASFTTEKRTKEIGIRKAMGASMQSICLLLVKEVTLLIAFSTLFAWPVAWYIMNRWLENFSYRIQPGITTFVISTLIAFVIALLTVSYQVRKAAAANPVDSLKYE
ncbi:MAG: FtsX-like permease family protein, partial [Bacteroidales bacterium]